jgi:hypothetical protein
MWSFEQHSRAGPVGRIFVGVWKKLLEISASEGCTITHSEVGDSSFGLMMLLIG